jgi:hypothetical protein
MYSAMRSVRAEIVRKGFTSSADRMIGLSPGAAVAEALACQGFVAAVANQPSRKKLRRVDRLPASAQGFGVARWRAKES